MTYSFDAPITRAEFWKHFDAARGAPNWQDLHLELHRAYWGAYVEAFQIKAPQHLVAACRAAVTQPDKEPDWHFNSPYTSLQQWDALDAWQQAGKSGLQKALRDNGEGWSASVNICLLKEAMRRHIERGEA